VTHEPVRRSWSDATSVSNESRKSDRWSSRARRPDAELFMHVSVSTVGTRVIAGDIAGDIASVR